MQNILITGSNRGIGLALVKEYLSRKDIQIFATCRNPAQADELQALAQTHPNLKLIPLDISDETSVARSLEQVQKYTDKLDILINNAGIYPRDSNSADFGYLKAENLNYILSTNTIAPIMLTQAYLELLKRGKGAKVIFISSRVGSITLANPNGFGYRMSKTALNMGMKIISQTLAPAGITVISSHPGHVSTDMGGAGAPVLPLDSAQGLVRIIDNLKPEQTGKFYNYTGEEFPW